MEAQALMALFHNPPLWERAAGFLWEPLSWIEAGHLQPLFPQLSLPVVQLPPVAQQYALERLGLAPFTHSFPVEDGSRFLLLELPTLTTLAQWLGALAYTCPLRSVMEGAQVRRLQRAFPGVYPEVLHALGWFLPELPRLQQAAETDEVPEKAVLERAGWRLLYAQLSHLPDALLRRLRLRFPPEMASLWEHPLVWKHRSEDILLLQRLLKRLAPGGYRLCCS